MGGLGANGLTEGHFREPAEREQGAIEVVGPGITAADPNVTLEVPGGREDVPRQNRDVFFESLSKELQSADCFGQFDPEKITTQWARQSSSRREIFPNRPAHGLHLFGEREPQTPQVAIITARLEKMRYGKLRQ